MRDNNTQTGTGLRKVPWWSMRRHADMLQQGVVPQFCDACNGELLPDGQEIELNVEYGFELPDSEESVFIAREGANIFSDRIAGHSYDLLGDKVNEVGVWISGVTMTCPHCGERHYLDKEVLDDWRSAR